MRADDALRDLFFRANWELFEQQSEALLHTKLDLTDFSVNFFVYNEQELFLSSALCSLPENEEMRFDLLKQAAALTAYVWLKHKISLTVSDNQLNLELVINTTNEDYLELTQRFLDDCDYFKENLAGVTSSLTAAPPAFL